MEASQAAGQRSDTMPANLSARHMWRRLAELAVFGAVVAALISGLPGLAGIRDRFSRIDPAFIVLIGVLELASTLSYVVAFRGVFCRKLSWRFSWELGMAEQATNVLLPTGGAGGLALGAWALRQGGMSSAANFVCAAVCGALLLLGVLHGHAPVVVTAFFTGGALATIGLAAALPSLLGGVTPTGGEGRLGRAVRRGAVGLANGIRDTGMMLREGRPSAIGGSIGYMGFDVAALAAAFGAFGGLPALGPFVLAYVVGQLGGLIPLPGGIGGTDGGLIGALVLYGTPLSQAATAVLIYRAFQLGLPSVLGAIAFVQLRARLARSDAPAAECAPLAEPLTLATAP
jgi:uncharacterized membrane protein YbhN (UPF0104 family)